MLCGEMKEIYIYYSDECITVWCLCNFGVIQVDTGTQQVGTDSERCSWSLYCLATVVMGHSP